MRRYKLNSRQGLCNFFAEYMVEEISQNGKHDTMISVSDCESLIMVKSIRKCNPNKLLFTVFKRHNHAAMARMYTKEELYQFLLLNSKNKDPFFPKFKKQRL
jgi:hypothetical protein